MANFALFLFYAIFTQAMGTSFNYVIFTHHRKKDGTIAVKIRMTHNGKSKYRATDICVTRDQLNRRQDRITDRRVLDAVEDRLRQYRDAVAQIDGSEWYTADQLWDAITELLKYNRGFRLDFIAFGLEVAATKEKGTGDLYRSALRSFSEFLGRDSIDINEITYPLLLDYRAWIERRNGRGCRSASLYLSELRHIHNTACDRYNDTDTGVLRIPRQPFRKGLVPPMPTTDHRALTVAQVKAIRDCQPTTARGMMARDVFMLSFYTIGMNTVDIYGLEHGDLADGVIEYHRAKTDSKRSDRALMRVRVEPEAAEILGRWKGLRRLLSFADRYADFRNFNKGANKGLKEVGALVGVPELTTYYPRHTWSTLAMNACGFDIDTVSQSLNHARRGSDRITGIYIERDFSRIWEANRKVLDLLK